MESLDTIRKNRELVNDIDWDMTPEEAITLYLEWGNNWSHNRMVKSKHDVSYYFVINSWESPPTIIFIRRNSDGAEELATIAMPEPLKDQFLASIHANKGVWALTDEVKYWLKDELQVYS